MSQTSLGWLICARLLLAGLSLGLAVILDRLEAGVGNPAIWGVYWTVIAAFLATICSALMVSRTRDPEYFAKIQVCIDVTIVTSLVYFSGAGESVFTFLYAIVVLYGALALNRSGVFLAAGLAAAGFGLVLFGSELGILPSVGMREQSQSMPILAAYWSFYAGALMVLGVLANALSAELRRTGAALDRRTDDLRRLRNLHLRTVESMGSGLLTTDEEGHITSFNPEAVRITGFSAERVEGCHINEIIPGAAEIVEMAISEEGMEPKGTRDRVGFRNQAGDSLFLGLGASSLLGDDGNDHGRVVIFQDVTRLVSMEGDLRRSERLAAVGEMAARIAHEIRNPLASISGSVQILQAAEKELLTREPKPEVTSEGERDMLMDIVVREVDRLNVLIGDFLLYSRPTPLNLQAVNLAEMVQEVSKMSEGQMEAQIDQQLDLDAGVEILADADQLRAVLWNLWNNAVEAMNGQGVLTVRVGIIPREVAQERLLLSRNGENDSFRAGRAVADAEMALLEIEDTGTGIDPEVQGKVFEPFFTTKRTGTGLGLATVQRIIEQHGGSIDLDSQPGVGTRFRILFPQTTGETETMV